jgi:hypothetical protein
MKSVPLSDLAYMQAWFYIPSLCSQCRRWLQLRPLLSVVQCQIPQLQTCLVAEIDVDRARFSSSCDPGCAGIWRPGKSAGSGDLPQAHHGGMVLLSAHTESRYLRDADSRRDIKTENKERYEEGTGQLNPKGSYGSSCAVFRSS